MKLESKDFSFWKANSTCLVQMADLMYGPAGKNMKPTVKYGGGSVIICAYGPGVVHLIDGNTLS